MQVSVLCIKHSRHILVRAHQINITEDLSVHIKDVKNISMIGHDHTNICCTGQLGFAFTNVSTLNIAKLSFAFCGAHISSEFTFTK